MTLTFIYTVYELLLHERIPNKYLKWVQFINSTNVALQFHGHKCYRSDLNFALLLRVPTWCCREALTPSKCCLSPKKFLFIKRKSFLFTK